MIDLWSRWASATEVMDEASDISWLPHVNTTTHVHRTPPLGVSPRSHYSSRLQILWTMPHRRIGIFSQLVPPTAKWTADRVPDQTGRVAIITGGHVGVGKEVARVRFSLSPARVVRFSLICAFLRCF